MRITLFLVGFCLSVFAWAQPNKGNPFIINYSTVDYRQGTQNFAVVQDTRGILYFGNSNGVLEFDGETWRLIKVANQSEVHALAVDESNGRVYVGAQGDFGYLKPDSVSGRLHYVSLLPLLEQKHRNFHDVWSINLVEGQVIFRSTAGVYLYRNNRLFTISLSSDRHRSFYLNNTFYLWQEEKGLMQLYGDSLAAVPAGAFFKDKSVHVMLPYSSTQILMITRDSGAYLYNGQTVISFETEADSLIKGQNMFGKALANGNYAIATRSNGLLIIDREGKLLQKIDEETGLLGSSVWDVYPDRFSDDLWLALNNGISLVEIASPFSRFGKEDGLMGQIYHLTRFRDKLFSAGSIGVFAKDWLHKGGEVVPTADHFQRVKNGQAPAWHLFADEDELLVASNSGILRFDPQTSELKDIGFSDRAWFFLPLKNYDGYMLVNTMRGIFLLKKVNKRWQISRKIEVPAESLYYFAQDAQGNIWAEAPTKGLLRINFSKGIEQEPSYALYTEKQGLPTRFKVRAYDLGNEVVFATNKGIYTFNFAVDKFVPHPVWNKVLAPLSTSTIEWLERDPEGNLWFVGMSETEKGVSSTVVYAAKTATGYELITDVFHKINHVRVRDFWIPDNENVFIGTSVGVVHYNTEIKNLRDYSVMVRRVELMGSDSTIFYGSFTSQQGKEKEDQLTILNYGLSYSENSLRFTVSSQDLKNPDANEYQFYLEGLDEGWGPWTNANRKEYTNLHEGNYKLHVRARNQYKQLSATQIFSFEVYPPWYRSLWAYLLYVVLAVLLVVIIMHLYGKRLKNQNLWLEQLISERTNEITTQNQNIREKNQELESAKKVIVDQYTALQNVNQKLSEKVKERTQELETAYKDLLLLKNELDTFIYKSSHDINGPMMRLRGLCQVAAMDVHDPKGLQYIELLSEEAEKSIAVLHKLLTFYHVKNAAPVLDVVDCSSLVDMVLKQLNKIRHSSGIQVCTSDLSGEGLVRTDPQMLSIILNQLLENAIIYRREQEPKVGIRIKCMPSSQIEIRIADNGIGIPDQVSEKIFNMFYRASEKSIGPGLGLYTARAAAAKLNGSVDYYKIKGWSVFKVRLPNLIALNPETVLEGSHLQSE